MDILLANPRGFCAGVDRAIEIVKRALETLGAPIYVRHEVVHNRFVVDDLKHRGAIFVEELDEVPDGATVIFSAHGVSQAVRSEADAPRAEGVRRHLPAGDQGAPGSRAPMPRRPRHGADRPRRPSGSRRHDGPVERARPAPASIYLVEDIDDVATLEVGQPDNLRLHHPDHAVGRRHPRHHRGAAARASRRSRARRTTTSATPPRTARTPCANWPRDCDLVLVVGSPNSSNSNRLRELAEREGVEAHLIDGADRDRPALGAGPPPHRRHRRRLRARRAGARRDRAPARARRAAACASWTASPRTWCSRCPRNCG